jgi:hypothetical protein
MPIRSKLVGRIPARPRVLFKASAAGSVCDQERHFEGVANFSGRGCAEPWWGSWPRRQKRAAEWASEEDLQLIAFDVGPGDRGSPEVLDVADGLVEEIGHVVVEEGVDDGAAVPFGVDQAEVA